VTDWCVCVSSRPEVREAADENEIVAVFHGRLAARVNSVNGTDKRQGGEPVWDLEYLMLFGVPGNKWELIDGQIRWAFPFLDRDAAEAHFATWANTLQRWRGARRADVHEATTASGSSRRIFRGGGFEMSLYPRPSSCSYQWTRAFSGHFAVPSGNGACGPGRIAERRRGVNGLNGTTTFRSTCGRSSANFAISMAVTIVVGR
jgi:hypothetical protein